MKGAEERTQADSGQTRESEFGQPPSAYPPCALDGRPSHACAQQLSIHQPAPALALPGLAGSLGGAAVPRITPLPPLSERRQLRAYVSVSLSLHDGLTDTPCRKHSTLHGHPGLAFAFLSATVHYRTRRRTL